MDGQITRRERVYNTLGGKNVGRTARNLWLLPWARDHYPKELAEIERDFPPDIEYVSAPLAAPPQCERGDPFAVGTYTDAWGCVFENVHKGIMGEVKDPLVQDEDWEDAERVHIPEEWLSFDVAKANAEIAGKGDAFTLCGAVPRPFEQMQFIRGTENLYVDLMLRPTKFLDFFAQMHDFYCRLLKKWAQTDIDALNIMDDWGCQNSLLINPTLWRELFLPVYRDYADIAHAAGKKIFMHSDGYILDIIPDLIDIGIDALNSQIFCMGVDKLKQFRGKITFWGEMDRQHLLPNGTPAEIDRAVREVYTALYDGGYCIAQCEFGPGAKPENVYQVFESWMRLTQN